MHYPAVGLSLDGVAAPEGADTEEGGIPVDSTMRMAPLAEARGVVRDVLAAVRNLEHLLRSPRVGPRALIQVIPGLKGFCDPLLVSVDRILHHVRAAARVPVGTALGDLSTYAVEVCDRLRTALDRVTGIALDAKSRLSFEAAIVQAGAELNSVRHLLDLLIRATEGSDTDLFVEELIQATFSVAPRAEPGIRLVKVVASYSRDSSGFHASPQVLMPLISAGIGMVRRAPNDRVFLFAACHQDEPVVFTISAQKPLEGVEYTFEPPLIVPPSLSCLETAARLASGTFEALADRVLISWPRRALA